jgi:hypothetical protein
MSFMQSLEWTTAGSYSWDVPEGVTHAWVTILGAGAGGARDLNSGGRGGHGGGAGELCSQMPLKVTPGDSIAVVIGAGGAGGFYANHTTPSGGSVATVGGNSSFAHITALGGGRFSTGGVASTGASFGAGVNGGLQGNPTFPLFADTIGAADSSRWFGGAGGGSYSDQVISPGEDGMPGGPAGGRLTGGAGGTDLNGAPSPGPGGGGGGTIYGIGGAGGDNALDGNPASISGTGGGGAGGTSAALGVGPFHDGAEGADGRATVFWIQP